MELTVEFIFIALILLALAAVSFLLWKEKAKTKIFSEKISEFTGSRNNDLFGKGKFSELGLMSAGIAHEISNPLSIIQGRITRLLRIYRDPAKQKEMADGLQQVRYTSDRIEKIIQGMRHYIYRDDEMVEDEILLSEIIETVLLFCGQRLKNHSIEFRALNVENIFLKGHRGQLEQALLNMINNSFDAVDTLPEKWIELSAVIRSDMVEIYVKDSGQGIPGDIKNQMLNPFYTTKKSMGTGLGLPLVKRIAEKHGGNLIYVEKAPNTTFMLELPKSATLY